MNRSERLAIRLQELFLDGKWVAHTNLKEQLEDLTWNQATVKIGIHNSIAELTFHINYYLGGVLKVLEGGDLVIRDKFSFDMVPISSEEDWQNLKKSLLTNAHRFIALVQNMDTKVLDTPFVKETYGTYERNLEGLLEHSYYHFGQISLLKKLMDEKDVTQLKNV